VSIFHIGQIRTHLEKQFLPFIDGSDLEAKSPDRESHMLSRALAAFAVTLASGVPAETAARSVTDGFGDHGLDAIYHDPTEHRLVIVQSKWHKDGKGSIDLGDALKFKEGIELLLQADLSSFNQKIQSHQGELMSALEDASTSIVIVVAHTGVQSMSPEVRSSLLALVADLNDPSVVAELREVAQADLHGALSGAARGAPINIDAMLFDWGQVESPFRAFYGRISAADVARWHRQHGPRLFSDNLRCVLPDSLVNKSMAETAKSNPERFWYFNNGITVLCQTVRKKLIGGPDRTTGMFECEGISVVNGAQTVGALSESLGQDGTGLEGAFVHVRFISIEGNASDFASEVTRATNTQNRIENKDFAALDPEQERLRQDLFLDGILYVYKSGAEAPQRKAGFTIEEATVALACAHDVSLAVVAKGNVGRLWEDIKKPPYKLLFNSSVSALRVNRCVDILRLVDGILADEQQHRSGPSKMVAIHGNRFLLHQVFKRMPDTILQDGGRSTNDNENSAREILPRLIDATLVAKEKLFPTSYLQSLFKNQDKCRKLDSELLRTANQTPRKPDA
jgi:hypothetical protein